MDSHLDKWIFIHLPLSPLREFESAIWDGFLQLLSFGLRTSIAVWTGQSRTHIWFPIDPFCHTYLDLIIRLWVQLDHFYLGFQLVPIVNWVWWQIHVPFEGRFSKGVGKQPKLKIVISPSFSTLQCESGDVFDGRFFSSPEKSTN